MSMTIQQAIDYLSVKYKSSMTCYHQAVDMRLYKAAEVHRRDFEATQIALETLREKAEREDPRPLTPDELRQMIGQPVWTVGVYLDGDTWAGWDIVDGFDNDGVTFGYSTEKPEWWAYDLRDQDGRLFGCAWVAYRHKPKEVQE